MKNRFFITFTVALLLAFGFAACLYIAIGKGMYRSNKDNQGKLNYIMKGTAAYDVLFMGSSRVFVQINPLIFDSLLGTNSYNAGTDGIRVAEMEVLMHHYLQHHPAPQTVYISIDETTLMNTSVWDYPRWFPYIAYDDVYALSRYQKEMKLAKYLPPVALTYYDDPKKSVGLQGLVRPGDLAYKQTKGFNPLAVAAAANIEPINKMEYYSDAEGIATFKRILKLCKQYKVQPVIVVPPAYVLHADTSDGYLAYKQVFNQATQGLPVLDFSTDSTFYNKELYRDATHLNEVGGSIYTHKIAAHSLQAKVAE